MDKIESPLHIISAQVCELGLTLAQRCTDDKSNEIPAVQDLLKELKIKGNIVVADALNCQKETAEIIVKQKADYLLSVKDNHPNLKKDIEDFVQDIALQGTMQTAAKVEKSHGRIEARTAFVTADIGWLEQKKEWANLKCIGAIRTEFITKKGTSNEWHYYLSSRELTAEQLLHHARMEWSVESMHWLLDVHFEEDWCRVESKDVQQCLNMSRKAAINFIKSFKIRNNSKSAISNIMFECLMEPQMILRVVLEN
jgi:predicted transposase YbfD/YdcC